MWWNDAKSTLTIGERQGRYPGMLTTRKFNIIKVSPDSPHGYNRDNKGHVVAYNGASKSVKL